MRPSRAVSLCAMLASTALALPALGTQSPARADTTPDCYISASSFDGYGNNGGLDGAGYPYEGAQADIENKPGKMCPSDYAIWADWSMVNNYSSAIYVAHAQVGFYRSGTTNGCVFWFAEYQKYDANSNPDYTRDIDYTHGCRTGSDAIFIVAFNPSTGHEDLRQDGIVIDSTPFNIFSVWTTPGFQVSAESNFTGTNIPGTTSDTTTVNNIILQRGEDSSWTTTSISLPTMYQLYCKANRYHKTAIAYHAFYFNTTSSTDPNQTCLS